MGEGMSSGVEKSFRFGSVGVMLFGCLMATGCSTPTPSLDTHVVRGETMGTTYSVKIAATPIAQETLVALKETIDETLEAVNDRMSTYRDDSELNDLNRQAAGAPLVLSNALFGVLSQSIAISIASGGAYDATVGPLVNAWGFGPDAAAEPPSGADLAALRDHVGYDKLTLDGSTHGVMKTHTEVQVDLSGIAKGYAVDRVAAALDKAGMRHYLVEVGGEMRASGANADGQAWRVGIERPVAGRRETQRIVPLADQALATSGDYRNYREFDGRRFSHILDPRSGVPIAHRTASASVIADTCATADAWATALVVLGPVEGLQRAEHHGLAALVLVRNDEGGFDEVTNRTWERMLESGS